MTKKAILLVSIMSLISCASTLQDSVVDTVSRSKQNDGKSITVSGFFREKNGYYNLFSKDNDECIGVLLTDQQKNEFRSRSGKRVTITGTLEAEGCGRDGICVEHLCGPTIMTNITALR